MSGFSVGSFSFSRSGHRGGFMRHSSHSSHKRHHYGAGGHHRQVRRSGCLGIFVVAALAAGGSLTGLVSLLA
ncbi:hypothetical protein K7W42_15830 [Deinococcus sp. HMF7604]|uniref:hypothetical protein n=1 Tax=Deinococcus betulae TaxID=2873312 RepID=UPI001CCA5A1B|nr:hypothetical protein [Deinococcus betulae]MBZ9752321.1 hypothetical protein [Deinococcus betulae]